MKLKDAQKAIKAILAAIDDDELPTFDRVEYRGNGLPVVWWDGTGYHLGSSRRNGQRHPTTRRGAISDAIVGEMVHRADKKLFENGDDPTGLTF